MALAGQLMEVQSNQVMAPRAMSMTERLHGRREQLERDLALVNEAIAALEGNEEIAKAVDAISKLGHF